jgi:hypothetical protein
MGIYPKDSKSAFYRDTCLTIFIAALLTIAQPWNQPKYPSVEEQMKEMLCMYTAKFYSVIKRIEIMSLVGKWIKMEIIVLSEIS